MSASCDTAFGTTAVESAFGDSALRISALPQHMIAVILGYVSNEVHRGSARGPTAQTYVTLLERAGHAAATLE